MSSISNTPSKEESSLLKLKSSENLLIFENEVVSRDETGKVSEPLQFHSSNMKKSNKTK